MAQILIRNISPEVVDSLKERARRSHRSLEAEARLILDEATGREKRIQEFRIWSETFRQSLKGRPQGDSAQLVREDRDR